MPDRGYELVDGVAALAVGDELTGFVGLVLPGQAAIVDVEIEGEIVQLPIIEPIYENAS